MTKIMIIGAGYVGLVTGICLAKRGNSVIIVETNVKKVQMLLDGNVPFYEPGLHALLQENIKNGNVSFSSEIETAFNTKPEIIFLCVGTPSLPDGYADLSYVWQAALEIGRFATEYCLVINKSTVPVGTTNKIKKIIETQLAERGLSIEFDVASNPEFLREGNALKDFLNPDRIVVGIQSKRSEDILCRLYAPFVHDKSQFLAMSIESSELSKYASNAMLATRISFMNEIAILAEKIGANVNSIKQAMSLDKRIGPYFLDAGVGYGGSCFPKDIRALIATGVDMQVPMNLLSVVEDINNKQRGWFSQKITDYFGYSILDKNIGIWGLAFKPDTDDMRCAPSIDIIQNLLERRVKILAYDPVASENAKNIFDNKINYAKTAREVLISCDFLIILTEWSEFLNFRPEDFCLLKDKVVFDGRNCFDPVKMSNVGVKYFDVGCSCSQNMQQLHKFWENLDNSQVSQI